jgi:hypothetical protein
VAPLGFANRWKAGGAFKGSVVMLALLIIGGYTRRNSKAKKANMPIRIRTIVVA